MISIKKTLCVRTLKTNSKPSWVGFTGRIESSSKKTGLTLWLNNPIDRKGKTVFARILNSCHREDCCLICHCLGNSTLPVTKGVCNDRESSFGMRTVYIKSDLLLITQIMIFNLPNTIDKASVNIL